MKISQLIKGVFLIVSLSILIAGSIVVYGEDLSHEQTVAIKSEIKQLVDDYAVYRDSYNVKGYGSVFTEDATFKFRDDIYKGRSILEKRIEDANKNTVSMHMMTSSQINIIDKDNATGIHYASIYIVTPDELHEEGAVISVNGPALMGQYHDIYKRTDKGWKIVEREFIPILATAK